MKYTGEKTTSLTSLQLFGKTEVVGSETVIVYLRNKDGNILMASGTTVPTATTAGYAKSALFIKSDASSGTKGLYENQGTASSCDFNVIGDITSAEIADGAITTAKIADGAVTDAKLNSASLVLKGETAGDRVEYGRETFTNSGTAAADVTVAVSFATAFGAAPKAVVLGPEADLTTYISTAASTTGVSITMKSVPASSTVYCNWIAIGQ